MLPIDLQAQLSKIENKIEAYKTEGKTLFVSSSFQTHSIPLLHILSKIDRTIPVYFLNTGFHFPQTIIFKNKVQRFLNVNIINLNSPILKIQQMNEHGYFHYSNNPDYCCHMNKVLPLIPVMKEKDVWISGVRKSQGSVRASFAVEEQGEHNTLRYHPILNWTNKMIYQYIKAYDLPKHPLDSEGYISIGCEPCTYKPDLNEESRDGRWKGMNKTECGLHTELVVKK